VPTRIFIVGTDTGVGKTAVTAALLRTACARGSKVVPFKPAQSGGERPSDAERLLAAAGLPLAELNAMCPLRFARPLAPGLAEDPALFVAGLAPQPGSPGALARCTLALAAWEARHDPELTLVEGAGGLHVPMPGGTWQPAWIAALAPYTVVVGRAGLGTINHCLATIAGLRALGRPPLGFVLSQTEPESDPSAVDNAAVIAHAGGVPHLGTLPHGPEPAWAPALVDALWARLPR
jgi:dethiobiotin synthetase